MTQEPARPTGYHKRGRAVDAMALDMLRRKGYIVVRSRRSCSLVHLVAFRAGTSLLDHIGLVQELEDLLGCHVDVVTGNSVKERMRSRVLKDAIEV